MTIRSQSNEAIASNFGRAALVGIAVVLVGFFAVALWLSPDPRGFGTHQQLGLPPCSFRLLFGRPCPSCGMTTCFTHFVRAEFVQAAQANFAGVVIASTCVLLIPWCVWSAVIGRYWLVSDPAAVGSGLAISLSLLMVLMWAAELAGGFY